MPINDDIISKLERMSGGNLTLGRLLNAIRLGEEKTLIEFSALLKVSSQYLSDLEHGRRFASPKAAVNYAKKLKYSPEQFLRLCLQDLLDREGLSMLVEVKKAA